MIKISSDEFESKIKVFLGLVDFMTNVKNEYIFWQSENEKLMKKVTVLEKAREIRQKQLKNLVDEKESWAHEKSVLTEQNNSVLEANLAKAQKLESVVEDLENKLAHQEKIVENQEKDFESKRKEISQKDVEISKLKAENQKVISRLVDLKSTHQSEIEQLREEVARKEAEKLKLKEQLETEKQRRDSLVLKERTHNSEKRTSEFHAPSPKRNCFRPPENISRQVFEQSQLQSQAQYDEKYNGRASTPNFKKRHVVRPDKDVERHALVKEVRPRLRTYGRVTRKILKFDDYQLKRLLNLFHDEAIQRVKDLFFNGKFRTANGGFSKIETVVLSDKHRVVSEFIGLNNQQGIELIYRSMTENEVKQNHYGQNNHYSG